MNSHFCCILVTVILRLICIGYFKIFYSFHYFSDPEDTYSQDWVPEQYDKRVSEFLGGPGKRLSEFLGGPGKRVSEFLGGPGKRLSEFLGGPGKRHAAGNLVHGSESKRVSEFLGGPGKRSQYYDFLENSKRR